MKFLVIQTAFIGDVVLATALIEKLQQYYPEAEKHFLVKKGNESLFKNNPNISKIWIFDKKNGKYKNIFQVIRQIRKEKFSHVINVHRHFSSGLLTIFSGANHTIGFKKNPLSIFFSKRIPHEFNQIHETERNQKLIEELTDAKAALPRLYPAMQDFAKVQLANKYICIAPSSVWFTKQYPKEKWIELINFLNDKFTVCLLGGKEDAALCEEIKNKSNTKEIINYAGKLNFLESAAFMKGAVMNFVNDSAPMHFASAVDAPVCAIYCSTVASFGFGPLSSRSFVVETSETLSCRPCGIHGKKVCPLGHFKCATIAVEKLAEKCFEKV